MSHILNSTAVLAGCSIAATLAFGVTMSAGGTLAAIPTSEWRSLLDQPVVRASRHEPHMQLLVSPVINPIGPGWG
jgi:hypothetical protein